MKEVVKIIQKMDIQIGVSYNGQQWRKQVVIVETMPDRDGRTRKIAMSAFGDNHVNLLENVREGDMVEVVYLVSSREYNGRWYTDVDLRYLTIGFAASRPEAPNTTPRTEARPATRMPAPPSIDADGGEFEDMPNFE